MSDAYMKKQHSIFCLLPCLAAIAVFVVAVMVAEAGDKRGTIFLMASGALLAIVALSFEHMVVRDEGDGLSIGFGPMPFVRTRVSYADIRKVECDRLKFLEVKPRRISWKLWRHDRIIWSAGGSECVVIYRNQDIIRVVTRDADELARLIQSRIVVA